MFPIIDLKSEVAFQQRAFRSIVEYVEILINDVRKMRHVQVEHCSETSESSATSTRSQALTRVLSLDLGYVDSFLNQMQYIKDSATQDAERSFWMRLFLCGVNQGKIKKYRAHMEKIYTEFKRTLDVENHKLEAALRLGATMTFWNENNCLRCCSRHQ